MPAILILLSLTACSDGTTSAMADYDTIIADMTTLVADHGAAVSSATTLEDVSAAEPFGLRAFNIERLAKRVQGDVLAETRPLRHRAVKILARPSERAGHPSLGPDAVDDAASP